MPLTKEELLKPRIKCVIDYPGNIFGVDKILQFTDKADKEFSFSEEWFFIKDDVAWGKTFFDQYKLIFKELRWHEDRAPEDMPKFVRYSEYYLNHYHLDGEFKKMIFKVDNWSNGHYGIKAKGGGIIHGYEINFEPADESEYNAYINQKQPPNKP